MLKIIHFEDKGQDFLKWIIGEDNIVKSALPCQASIWKGVFVHPATIKEGMKPIIEINDTTKLMYLKIVAIEYIDVDNPLTRQKKSFLELGNKLSEALNLYDNLENIPSESDLMILNQKASDVFEFLAKLTEL